MESGRDVEISVERIFQRLLFFAPSTCISGLYWWNQPRCGFFLSVACLCCGGRAGFACEGWLCRLTLVARDARTPHNGCISMNPGNRCFNRKSLGEYAPERANLPEPLQAGSALQDGDLSNCEGVALFGVGAIEQILPVERLGLEFEEPFCGL
jgi:hypothetical protein